MLTEQLSKLLWLNNTIKEKPGITYKEINERWRRSSLSEGMNMPRSTFNFWKDRVEELFNVEIICKNHKEYSGYTIKNLDKIYRSNINEWLLSTLCIKSQISKEKKLYKRIQLEDIPSGQKYLLPIIDAMKKGKAVTFLYQKFIDEEPEQRYVEPYCVKVSERRWYLIGRDTAKEDLRTFALDRFLSFDITKQRFKFPKTFSINEHFKYSYGIYGGKGFEPVSIRLRAYDKMVKYLRTLPLHSSQEEVLKKDSYSEFTLTMAISYDLKQYFLSQGDQIEILEPHSLRDDIKAMLINAVRRYE